MLKNDTLTFGNYTWRVLADEDGRMLIISEAILALRWYHCAFDDVTWATCELRKHLNNDFYNTFSQGEKERIITVENRNPDNPWFKTKGGIDTADRLFLLSLDEVCACFGDSRERLLTKGSQKWQINDENNLNRRAKFGDGFHWWRLRSPGYYARTAASVGSNGNVYVRGNGVYGSPKDSGGVRPALWLRI